VLLPLKDTMPGARAPVATLALIAVNTLVFLVVQGAGWDGSLSGWAAVPCDLAGRCGVGDTGDLLSAVTGLFLHGSLLHLAGVLLFLWLFGATLEDTLGRPLFLALYLAGGLAGTALVVAAEPGSGVPVMGAAGAVSAVLGAYLVLYPRARIIWASLVPLFFTLLETPALLLLGVWGALVAAFALSDVASGGIASGALTLAAPLGGLLLGAAAGRLIARPKPYAPAPYPVA
jgi:membrane associated rhomboid family serine protease